MAPRTQPLERNTRLALLCWLVFAILLGLLWPFSSLAQKKDPASATRNFELVDGEVGFVCEGPKVKIPAWGTFRSLGSRIKVDPENLSEASGYMDVMLISIRTDDALWDRTFRDAGFLEIEDFPRSRFVIERVRGARRLEPGAWTNVTVDGVFSLHGVAKKKSVPASVKWRVIRSKARVDEEIELRAYFRVWWRDHDIAVPRGLTRVFAGDGARVQVTARYAMKKSPRPDRSRPHTKRKLPRGRSPAE